MKIMHNKLTMLSLAVASCLAFLPSGPAQAYTSSYSATVTEAEGTKTGDDGGYAWRNLEITVKDSKITLSLDLKVWNDNRTPITQVFVCVKEKVYKCIFNRVPSKKDSEEYKRVEASFSVNLPTPDKTYDISLIQTKAMTPDAGKTHIEVEGGAREWMTKIGELKTQ